MINVDVSKILETRAAFAKHGDTLNEAYRVVNEYFNNPDNFLTESLQVEVTVPAEVDSYFIKQVISAGLSVKSSKTKGKAIVYLPIEESQTEVIQVPVEDTEQQPNIVQPVEVQTISTQQSVSPQTFGSPSYFNAKDMFNMPMDSNLISKNSPF